ncbi:MAG TPA: DUF308 domain-containing protein [Thermoleophilaceae bacterium]
MYLSPLGEASVDAERDVEATGLWWVPLIAGLLTIIVGIVVLRVEWTVSGLAIFLGVVFIIRGLVDAFKVPLDGSPRGLAIVVGVLEACVGVALIAWPGPGLTVVAAFFGCWLVLVGGIEIVGALVNREHSGWWLVLLLGIVMVILGIWALDKPAQTLHLIIALAGIWAIVAGTVELVFAFELRKMHREALSRQSVIDTAAATTTPSAAL